MKKLLIAVTTLFIMAGVSSCSKCYVCVDKNSSTYSKVEYCNKDYSKGDIDNAIKFQEALGYTCHAKSRAF
jgi:hypothetical protein